MITEVTYKGRRVTVVASQFEWVPKWMPKIVPLPSLMQLMELSPSRSPVLARKKAVKLIEAQIKKEGI